MHQIFEPESNRKAKCKTSHWSSGTGWIPCKLNCSRQHSIHLDQKQVMKQQTERNTKTINQVIFYKLQVKEVNLKMKDYKINNQIKHPYFSKVWKIPMRGSEEVTLTMLLTICMEDYYSNMRKTNWRVKHDWEDTSNISQVTRIQDFGGKILYWFPYNKATMIT